MSESRLCDNGVAGCRGFCPECKADVKHMQDARGIGYMNVPAEVEVRIDTADEYARWALRTAPGDPLEVNDDDELVTITKRQYRMLLGIVGLMGEAGEMAEMIKKHIFHEHPMDYPKLEKESGDVTWYLNYLIVRTLKSSWQRVWTRNINKLRARYPTGAFRATDSINRKPGDD